jgi:hypothetical protein
MRLGDNTTVPLVQDIYVIQYINDAFGQAIGEGIDILMSDSSPHSLRNTNDER